MNVEEILSLISAEKFDAIIVEGYDGVGKGRLLNILSEYLGVIPYRPDYNFWNKHDLRREDRWKISGFFWDVLNHFNIHPSKPMLFDRGVLSGSVYNDDQLIAKDYKSLISNMNVLHILVTCSREDFDKFSESRGSDTRLEWRNYYSMTEKYKSTMMRNGLLYVIFENVYTPEIDQDTCECCGHYNHGWCRHPILNEKVDPKSKRCKYSNDKEVQDLDVTEMYSM